MTTEDTNTTAAGGSQLVRGVRPVAQVQRMGSFQGVPHYGCLLTIEAEQRMKVNDPLYGQAELDAAVAAERERCARIVERINGWTGTREIAAEIRGETNVLRA